MLNEICDKLEGLVLIIRTTNQPILGPGLKLTVHFDYLCKVEIFKHELLVTNTLAYSKF